KLETLGASLEALFKPPAFTLAPVVVIDAGEIKQGEREEPARMGLVKGLQGFLEPGVPAAVQIDNRANTGGIHLGQVALDTLRRQKAFAAAQMVVDVYDRVRRSLDDGGPGLQHRARLPIAEL